MNFIFKREFIEHLTSLRFCFSLFIVLALMVLNCFVFSTKYQKEFYEYHKVINEYENFLAENSTKGLHELVDMEHIALKPPLKHAFLTMGGQGKFPNSLRFYIANRYYSSNYFLVPLPEKTHNPNTGLRPFDDIDWTFIIKVVLSFTMIVLLYDAISGEKESGTLKLVLSNSISRWKILLGKFMAGLLSGFSIFLIGALFSVLILINLRRVQFDLNMLKVVSVFIALTVAYLALFGILSLLVSSLTSRSVTSLITLLLLWITFIFIIPGVSNLLAHKVYPVPTLEQLKMKFDGVNESIEAEFKGRDSAWRGRELGKIDNYTVERLSAKAYAKRNSLYDKIVDDYLQRKFIQAAFVRKLSMISPSALFQESAESAAGVGILRDRRFIEQVRIFRNALRDFANAIDANDTDSPHIVFEPTYMSTKAIDPKIVPRFEFCEASIPEGLNEGLTSIIVLIIETIFLFACGYIATVRYDPR